jgi:DNA-binding response OmpR family regulator
MPCQLNIQKIPLADVPMNGLRCDPGPVVLVVDDERIIADTRSAILTSWGYAVMTAYSAESALEMARRNPPRVLVANLSLNRINGADLARVIRSKSSDCQVILLSGLIENDSLIADARDAGCNFTLLRKPIHPNDLRALLPEIGR